MAGDGGRLIQRRSDVEIALSGDMRTLERLSWNKCQLLQPYMQVRPLLRGSVTVVIF